MSFLEMLKALGVLFGLHKPADRNIIMTFIDIVMESPLRSLSFLIWLAIWLFILSFAHQHAAEGKRIKQKKMFTAHRLATYDGRLDRRKTLLAFNGVVFDITKRASECPSCMRGRPLAYPPGSVAHSLLKKLRDKFAVAGTQSDYKEIVKLLEADAQNIENVINRITDNVEPCFLPAKSEAVNMQATGVQHSHACPQAISPADVSSRVCERSRIVPAPVEEQQPEIGPVDGKKSEIMDIVEKEENDFADEKASSSASSKFELIYKNTHYGAGGSVIGLSEKILSDQSSHSKQTERSHKSRPTEAKTILAKTETTPRHILD